MDSNANLFRAPSWRWQEGVRLAEERGPYRPCPDSGVRAARRFWGLWTSSRGEDAQRPALSMPTVYEAFALFRGKGGPARALLEARVLANEDSAVIAAKGGLRESVVLTYEELFFDVRGSLGQPDYIFSQALAGGRRPGQSQAEADRERTWKLLGYVGGPWVVDALVSATSAAARPADLAGGAAFVLQETQAVLGRHLAVAVRQLCESDPAKAAALLRAWLPAMQGRGDESAPTSIAENIHACLTSLRFALASPEQEVSGEVTHPGDWAGEQRAGEMFWRSLGPEPSDEELR